jgi:hypothetical protein
MLQRNHTGRAARRQAGAALLKPLLAVVAVLLLLFVGFVTLMWHWSYSEGERAGYVQKLSKKGYLCKTWEGEMAIVPLPGTIPEKFYFTLWDDAVAEQINRNIGKRVTLHYQEKVGLPTSCFGDTRHYVTRLTLLEPQ